MLRRVYLILSLSILCVFALQAQEERLYLPVNAEFNNVRLDSALNILEKETDLYFTYDASKVPVDNIIKASFNYIPLSVVLDSIINDPYLVYQLIDKQLVIYSADIPEEENKSINSQDVDLLEDEQILIEGRILDLETKMNLPFVNIGIKSKSIGTISNENGGFLLKVKRSMLNDTIAFSYMGYKSNYIVIKDYIPNSDIYLEPNVIPLQEVVIRSTDPKSLIRYAIQSRKDNYSNNASLLRCFYREVLTRNKRYKMYTEGLLDVYKSPYRPTLFTDQIKLLKRRTFSNLVAEDTVQFKLQGGLKTSLDLDIVKYPMEFIHPSTLNTYIYTLSDIVTYDDRLLYQIDFRPYQSGDKPGFEGSLYIDVVNLAIVRVSFRYTPKSLKAVKNDFVLRKSRAIKVTITNAEYDITYKLQDGRYYISRIYGSVKTRVKKRRKFLASNFETSFELVTTDIHTENIERFKRKETLRPNRIFSEIDSEYDRKFWNGDNFVLPEKDLTKALNRFKTEELKINGNQTGN